MNKDPFNLPPESADKSTLMWVAFKNQGKQQTFIWGIGSQTVINQVDLIVMPRQHLISYKMPHGILKPKLPVWELSGSSWR